MSALFEIIQDAGLFGTVVVVFGLLASALAALGILWALAAPDRARLVAGVLAGAGLVLLVLTFAGHARDSALVEEALAFAEADQHARLLAYGQASLHGLLGLGFAAAALPLAGASGAFARSLAKGGVPWSAVGASVHALGVALVGAGLSAHQLLERQILRVAALSDAPEPMKAALRGADGGFGVSYGLIAAGLGVAMVGAGLTQVGGPRASE